MKNLKLAVLVAVMVAIAAATVQAADKVQVCHIPPGDPANFHTIKVGENALSAHLAHGDVAGNCSESCDALCDDGNACTQDHAGDCEAAGCLAAPEPVDCDDSLLCTVDTCDPAVGCQYAPIVCDDGDNCTVDACNPADGQCTATPKDCGDLGLCVGETGACEYPCDGITCDPIDQCHAPGECVLPGTCVDGAPVADGTPCDDGDAATANDQCDAGVCSGDVVCPCNLSFEQLDCVLGGGSPTCFNTVDNPGGNPADRSIILFHQQSTPNACYQGADGLPFSDYGPADFPVVLLEDDSVWAIPFIGSNPSYWPLCLADSYAHPLGEGWNIGLTQEQIDACFDDVEAYVAARGITCAQQN